MAPLSVAGAIAQTSLIGPEILPPAAVVSSTFSGSVGPLACVDAASQTFCGRGKRPAGFVAPKQPLYSNLADFMCT